MCGCARMCLQRQHQGQFQLQHMHFQSAPPAFFLTCRYALFVWLPHCGNAPSGVAVLERGLYGLT